MIQVNISEMKNRLSYYLRLVKGGEQIEIVDRKTPLARLIHVSQVSPENESTPWIKELQQLGIVGAPKKKGYSRKLLSKDKLSRAPRRTKPAVLDALLEERESGR